MPERTAILNSIQSLRAMRKEFTARFDKLEDELLRLLETQPEASPPLPHSNSPEEWLTAREVCKALKISDSTLYAKIKDGTLPDGIAFSARSKRWRMSDIQAWQEAKHNIPEIQPQIATPKRRGRVSRIMRVEDFSHV